MLVVLLSFVAGQCLGGLAMAQEPPVTTATANLAMPTKPVMKAYCDAHQLLKQGSPSKADLQTTLATLVEERALVGSESLLPILQAVPKERWEGWLAATLHFYDLQDACYLVSTEPPVGPTPSQATLATLCHVMTPQPQQEVADEESSEESNDGDTSPETTAAPQQRLLEQATTLVGLSSLPLPQRKAWMQWHLKRVGMTQQCQGWSWPDEPTAMSEAPQNDEAP